MKINYLVKLELSVKEIRSVTYSHLSVFVIANGHRPLASLAVRFPHGEETFVSLVTLLSQSFVKRSDVLISQTS